MRKYCVTSIVLILALVAVLASPYSSYAQDVTKKSNIQTENAQKIEKDNTKSQEKAIKVFLDISEIDNEHIKREIPFIDYVRDRKQAQIHIMMTTQLTGSGGKEYSLFFIGQEEFNG
jgi:hypothetical protein